MWRITVSPEVVRYLWVTVGGTIERNITLGLSTLAETVTVSGTTTVLDSRQTGVAGSFGREAVEALPTARQGTTAYLGTFPGVALGSLASRVFPSPNFGQQTTWPIPRQLLLRAEGDL